MKYIRVLIWVLGIVFLMVFSVLMSGGIGANSLSVSIAGASVDVAGSDNQAALDAFNEKYDVTPYDVAQNILNGDYFVVSENEDGVLEFTIIND